MQVTEIETRVAARHRDTGTAALRRKKILAQHWNDRPCDAEPRHQLSPAVAGRDKWRRIERLKHNKVFQALYRAAFDFFRVGLAAVFPLGTWSMRFRAAIQIGTA